MAPLAVDPDALSGAGAGVVAVGDAVAAAVGVLASGFGANTGQDAAGEVFGLAYQDAAEAVVKAAAAGISACRRAGFKVQVSASNYARAEAASMMGGGAEVLPTPSQPGSFDAPGAPGTLGPGVAEPALWAVVEAVVGDLWPNGDPAGLRGVAGRWRTFGSALHGVSQELAGPKVLVAAQHIPEGELVRQALATIGADMATISAECGKLASRLDEFAREVANTQDAIRDLLHRLGSVSGLWHEVVAAVTGHGLDEVKKIANDIKAVLHNLMREAQAREQLLSQGMQVIDGLVRGLEIYVRGEITHYVGEDVGNPLATVFDTYVNVGEGVFKDVVGMVQGIEQLDPLRFGYDPKGAAATWKGLAETLGLAFPPTAPLVDALDPQFRPNFQRQLVHADDWRADRPGLGAGENVGDILSFLIPGAGEAAAGARGAADVAGAVGKAGEAADVAGAVGLGGRVAGEAGELARATAAMGDIGKTTSKLATNLDNIGKDLPKTDPAAGGRPGTLPPPTPGGPPVSPAPHQVEPKPGTAPPAPAPARVPVSPDGVPAELPAAAAHAATHTPSAPHAPKPEPTPAGGHPPAPRPPLDGVARGGHPSQTWPPHDGAAPGDPHGSQRAGDGSPSEHDDGGDPHDHSPEPYRPSDVAVEAAHRTYERATWAEPEISPAVVDAVRDAGGHLERFESRLKDIDSLARKLDGELKDVNPSDLEEVHIAENDINDAVRYTAVVPENGYWAHGDAVIKVMEERGFTLTDDPAGWRVPNVYRGRNLTFQTPDGVKFEVQIHTGDSLSAAEQTHLLYDEKRLPTTSLERQAELQALQAEVFNRVPVPEGTPLIWKDP